MFYLQNADKLSISDIEKQLRHKVYAEGTAMNTRKSAVSCYYDNKANKTIIKITNSILYKTLMESNQTAKNTH